MAGAGVVVLVVGGGCWKDAEACFGERERA